MDTVKVQLSSNIPHQLSGRISRGVDEVLQRAVSAINATDVTIHVGVDVNQTIQETGVGGSTENPHTIRIWIDPTHPNVIENIESEIRSTLVHELHHAMRNRLYPWPGTLLDDIVAEGLADHFDIEINGQEPKPWSKALSEEELAAYQKKAQAYFYQQNTEDDYYRWVLGLADDDIPQWAGYALGFKLVGDYLSKTGKKASELVDVKSSVFIE